MASEIESPTPEPVYRLLDGTTEAAAAIEQVIGGAQRDLRIFDASPRTLRERGFGDTARVDVLRRLLLASRGHTLRIALHNPSGIESELPRLMGLLTQFSGQVHIHRTLGQAAEARDPMIIADDAHFWRRPHIDHPRSVLTLNNSPDTRPFLERFEEIWGKSELAVSGTTLGL